MNVDPLIFCNKHAPHMSICFQIFPNQPVTQTFAASLIAGNCVAITMQPLDVIATRLYNQGNNRVYGIIVLTCEL